MAVVILAGQSNMVGQPGVGPAESFAQMMALMGQPTEYVNCAVGATTIEQWAPGGALYQACMKQVAGRPVTGVLFYQGESDAELASQAQPGQTPRPTEWRRRFIALVDAWRTDTHRPELPVVFAQLATTGDPVTFPNWETIRQQQAASVDIPGITMIETEDLVRIDTVHLDNPSYVTLGQRFAVALLRAKFEAAFAHASDIASLKAALVKFFHPNMDRT